MKLLFAVRIYYDYVRRAKAGLRAAREGERGCPTLAILNLLMYWVLHNLFCQTVVLLHHLFGTIIQSCLLLLKMKCIKAFVVY